MEPPSPLSPEPTDPKVGTFSVPKTGAAWRPHIWTRVFHDFFNSLEAFAVWQWWNYCSSQVPVGKTSLTINLDETSICLYQGGGKGNIFVSKQKMAAGETEPIQRIARGKTRSCMTHVAFICDNPDVQRVLPQVILGNEATFPASAFPLLYRSSPGNVKLIRQKSAWNNELLCAVTPI